MYSETKENFLWTAVWTASTLEDLVQAGQIAIAIATFPPGSAACATFLPLFVQHGLANLFELFVFARLHYAASVQVFRIRTDDARPLRQRFMSLRGRDSWPCGLLERHFFRERHFRNVC